ncbi:heavy metal sensor kinase [Bryocella elongata]|uniref:histidine kinase n=1 Tax=Bryocella elongata TaxID=863522 RepID=A0A1H5TQB1_9BACT|nr:ATP-binding protein [Bryocella elongata]SEF64969.1 heavy metal sensor kinase [Bryocella elongata]
MIRFRSIRVKLNVLYVLLTVSWMSVVGLSTYLYLRRALLTSRAETMQRREQRLEHYINDTYAHVPGISLRDQLRYFMDATVAPYDTLEIFDLSGRRIYPDELPHPSIQWPEGICRQACFGEVTLDGHRMRTLKHAAQLDGRPVVLCLAGSMDEHYDVLDRVIRSFLIAAPLMLIASVAAGFLLSRRAMHPVDRMTSDARTIGIGSLERRLPVPDTGDEIQRLAETWNELLERVDLAVGRLKQFTHDLSHDLRTSTTVMLATAQMALRAERSSTDYRAALTTIANESIATSRMLDDLLAIASTDPSQQEVVLLPLDLNEVVEEACEQLQGHAALKHQHLCWTSSAGAYVRGDLPLLRRLVTILIDNAVKYTPENGTISARAHIEDSAVVLQVTDNGIGISPSNRERIFDRFFREDPSRAHEGGRGLGLAIAKGIAAAHHAGIDVISDPGAGSTFSIRFPRYVPEIQVERRPKRLYSALRNGA